MIDDRTVHFTCGIKTAWKSKHYKRYTSYFEENWNYVPDKIGVSDEQTEESTDIPILDHHFSTDNHHLPDRCRIPFRGQ